MGNSWERSFNETKVLPVLFPIKTKEAYGNEQMVPLVKGVTSFFSRKDKSKSFNYCVTYKQKIKRVKLFTYFIHCEDPSVCV